MQERRPAKNKTPAKTPNPIYVAKPMDGAMRQ
jgi:hypothetical protein